MLRNHLIKVIHNKDSASSDILHQIHSLRYRVFCERKGWVESNDDELEIDEFDDLEVVHFAYLDETSKVQGCYRLLPTTGPYMLRNVFPELLGGETAPIRKDIYEISRFAIDIDENYPANSHNNLSVITSALLLKLFEYAKDNQINSIVGVTDTAFEVLLRRAGLYTKRYSPPRKIGNCLAVAGYAEPTDINLARLKERFNNTLKALDNQDDDCLENNKLKTGS